MPLLTDTELLDALGDLPGWAVHGGALERAFSGADFAASIDLVNRIAALADEADHHPDLDVRWDTVVVRLTTHSKGGITHRDVELARRIGALVA